MIVAPSSAPNVPTCVFSIQLWGHPWWWLKTLPAPDYLSTLRLTISSKLSLCWMFVKATQTDTHHTFSTMYLEIAAKYMLFQTLSKESTGKLSRLNQSWACVSFQSPRVLILKILKYQRTYLLKRLIFRSIQLVRRTPEAVWLYKNNFQHYLRY